MAASIVTQNTTSPSGKAAGTTTLAGTAGSGFAGLLGTLIAYFMVKSGFEQDATVAVLIGGTVGTLLATAGSFFLAKRTPTNQTKTVETVVHDVVEAPARDLDAKREAASNLDPLDRVPDGPDHRAEGNSPELDGGGAEGSAFNPFPPR